MPRPISVQITQALERDDGVLLFWVLVGLDTIAIQVPPEAITNRKLIYGYAHINRTVGVDGGGRELGYPTTAVVDNDADADAKALRAILAEHVDRLEAAGINLATDHVPPNAAAMLANSRFVPKASYVGAYVLAAQAPARMEPQMVQIRVPTEGAP